MTDDSIARMALAQSAATHLEPGEEIMLVEDQYSAVEFWKGRRGIEDLPTPDRVRFVKSQMGVVITTRRFLMFRMGGFLKNRADEVLTDLPVAEVDSIECIGHALRSFEAKLTIHGIEYGFLVAHIGACHTMEKALEAAKGGAASV